MTKSWLLSLVVIFLGVVFCSDANAEAIEHRGDRYVIHVDQLDLDGDESLMEVLMLCPEFVSWDDTDVLSMYAIRIGHINIDIGREACLYHTKAHELGTLDT